MASINEPRKQSIQYCTVQSHFTACLSYNYNQHFDMYALTCWGVDDTTVDCTPPPAEEEVLYSMPSSSMIVTSQNIVLNCSESYTTLRIVQRKEKSGYPLIFYSAVL